MFVFDSHCPLSQPVSETSDAAVAAALVQSTPAIIRVCRRFVDTLSEAEELCQETLLVAWRRRDVWTGEGSLQAWACAIARNLGRNAARKRRELLRDPALPEPADNRPTVTDRMVEAQRHSVLRNALDQLPADELQVLELRYSDGWKAPRINAHLGLSGAGARAVLQRARRRLRRILDEAPESSLYDVLRLAA